MKTKNNPKVIADTCIWVEFFRTKSEISNRLRDLISNNLVAGVGIIIAELLQGIKTNKEREIILNPTRMVSYPPIVRHVCIFPSMQFLCRARHRLPNQTSSYCCFQGQTPNTSPSISFIPHPNKLPAYIRNTW